MILNCDICGRPDHNSEVHPESRCWREQGTQSGRLDCFERGYVRLKAEVAVAEERGRRRGVEEAAIMVSNWCGSLSELTRKLRALAPRDSAPVCGVVASYDPFHEPRCGKPKGHDGRHDGEGPLGPWDGES